MFMMKVFRIYIVFHDKILVPYILFTTDAFYLVLSILFLFFLGTRTLTFLVQSFLYKFLKINTFYLSSLTGAFFTDDTGHEVIVC